MRALTFDQDTERSGILEKQEAHLRPIFKGQINKDNWPATSPSYLPPLPNDLVQECTGFAPTGLVPGQVGFYAAVPIVTAGVMLFMDSVTSAIEGYIAEKRREMEKSYEGHINEEKISLDGSTSMPPKNLKCIDVVRMVTIEGKTAPQTAMRAVFQFKPVGAAYYLRPIFLKVPYAAAVTENDKGVKVAVNVRLTTAFPPTGSSEPKLVTPVNQNFVFKPVKLGQEYHHSSPKPENVLRQKSPIFVWPTAKDVTSTIFVSVTEAGSGVEIFDKASPQLQGSSKRISEAIRAIIKEELGE